MLSLSEKSTPCENQITQHTVFPRWRPMRSARTVPLNPAPTTKSGMTFTFIDRKYKNPFLSLLALHLLPPSKEIIRNTYFGRQNTERLCRLILAVKANNAF
jgi:hypothetical protein